MGIAHKICIYNAFVIIITNHVVYNNGCNGFPIEIYMLGSRHYLRLSGGNLKKTFTAGAAIIYADDLSITYYH